MHVRKLTALDAENYLKLCETIDEESEFMLFEPGERKLQAQRQIKQIQSGVCEVFVCAADDGSLVGYVAAVRGQVQRTRHRAHIIIGIRQTYIGQGIGVKLFQALEKWACEEKLHRLELTVMTHHTAAVRLYKKMGFIIEGTKKHALKVKGQYVDEYVMSKLINE
ncbi:GNAT family N-acetyltransferase [Bacillus paralicheniformis]|uniref:GNAT family N-acetyltransferase n=1 Tax=Bacillus paralicheniformis TaxID=1648923 RepID=UPI00227F3496|nr:GNAT family protein [Bacillus paralicheniformis]MCY8038427.1 GNAT family N-acetyltransferase [Bacillus paralicheniformis]